MTKPWQPYARHILDSISKIRRILARGDLTQYEVLYDAALRNLQTLSEATQPLPEHKKAAWPAIPWQHAAKNTREVRAETRAVKRDMNPMNVARQDLTSFSGQSSQQP